MNKMTVLIFALALSGCATDPLPLYVAGKIEADAAAAIARSQAIGDQANVACLQYLGPLMPPPVGPLDFFAQQRGFLGALHGPCAPIAVDIATSAIGAIAKKLTTVLPLPLP